MFLDVHNSWTSFSCPAGADGVRLGSVILVRGYCQVTFYLGCASVNNIRAGWLMLTGPSCGT